METGQGIGLPELPPHVKSDIEDAAYDFLHKTRSRETRDLIELLSLLERFYRYGLEEHQMLSYKITWSEEDEAYVATVDGGRFPSLSYVDPDPIDALGGLWELLAEEMNT